MATIGGSGGQPETAGQGGEAGQEAGGAGAPSKTPVELGCSFAQACLDGRDGYKCPSSVEPEGCVRFMGGSALWCCGAPKPATCDPVYAAGATLATARDTNDFVGSVSLPAAATAWLSITAETGSSETKPMSVKSTALPLGSPIQVCIGYQCADGSDGVSSCAIGQKVVDGITLCCLDSDSATTGAAAKTKSSCPNNGERTAYARFVSKSEACIDVKQIAFTSFAN